MDITCSTCGTTLKVPDEKLPPNQVVSLTCPKCKGKIRVDTAELVTPGAKPEKEDSGKGLGFDDKDDTGPLEFFEEGTRLALVLDADEMHLSEIAPGLEEVGYKCIQPVSLHEAMSKIRLHHFDMVILSDGFDGKGLDGNPITNYLNHISMSVRRKIFLVLISGKFKTMDNMAAFAMSANLLVNPDDLSNFVAIIKKATSDNDKFYKIYMDTLREVGKD